MKLLFVGSDPQLVQRLTEALAQATDLNLQRGSRSADQIVSGLRASPDMLLLELTLVDASMVQEIRRLRRMVDLPPLIALCPQVDERHLWVAVSLGAAACLPQDTPPEFLISTIRHVAQGEHPIDYLILQHADLASSLLQQLRELPLAPPLESVECPLSPRELEILRQVAQGRSNSQIASALAVQEQTVKNYVSAIMRRLDAPNRTYAVAIALQNGWLNLVPRVRPPRG